jgi:hypothetical protein
MEHSRDDHLRDEGPGLRARLDKMRAAGRISQEEADRVRSAAGSGEFDAAVAAIRLRHASEWIATGVAEGRFTQTEADEVLERLRKGEDPRVLSGLRRRQRPRPAGS